MKIHERYVGRVLHCPHCGLEFLADPTLADVDDLMEDLVPDDKRGFPWLVVVAVVVLAVAVVILGQARHSGLLADLFKPTRNPGQFANLLLEDRKPIPAAMDRETAEFVVAALEDADPGSLQALRVQGKIIDLAPATQVKLIERNRRNGSARVRVLEGQWTGRVLWVPLMTVQ
jgi:hypothetical protein